MQRDRLRQIDRDQLEIQMREGIQSVIKRGEEAALATAETAEAVLNAAQEEVDESADAAAEADEDTSEKTSG